MKRIILAAMAIFMIMPVFAAKKVEYKPQYKSFEVAIYTRAYEVQKMADTEYLESTWATISSQMKVDKIYLETHRDKLIVDQKTLDKAKKFFTDRGVQVAGGITYTIDEGNNFQTFSYKTPEERKLAQEIAEYTAKNFDEIILDDFFFIDQKNNYEIDAKGDMGWTEFRLEEMGDAGKYVVLDPAHKVNPNCKIQIKYPNWYDDFQGCGFDLGVGPYLFDGVWSGTETRDPSGDQHLQNYLSYNIITFLENINGNNGGGWVDSGGIQMGTYRYCEQLRLTMFAKARTCALFNYASLANSKNPDNADQTIASLAGREFETIDEFVYKLGNPVGVKSQEYANARGDDFLHNWFGMIGVPMDVHQKFPEGEKVVFLTAGSSNDPSLKSNIDKALRSGADVIITSGLLEKAKDVIDQFAEFEIDGYVLINDFGRYGKTDKDLLFKKLRYFTNDTWSTLSMGRPLTGGTNNFPFMLRGKYSEGNIYVINVPEDFSDLYVLPEGVLNQIRQLMCKNLPVRLEAPAYVSIFLYDNNTFIVESFSDKPVNVKVVTDESVKTLENIVTGEKVNADPKEAAQPFGFWGRGVVKPENKFSVSLAPHTYQVFKF